MPFIDCQVAYLTQVVFTCMLIVLWRSMQFERPLLAAINVAVTALGRSLN